MPACVRCSWDTKRPVPSNACFSVARHAASFAWCEWFVLPTQRKQQATMPRRNGASHHPQCGRPRALPNACPTACGQPTLKLFRRFAACACRGIQSSLPCMQDNNAPSSACATTARGQTGAYGCRRSRPGLRRCATQVAVHPARAHANGCPRYWSAHRAPGKYRHQPLAGRSSRQRQRTVAGMGRVVECCMSSGARCRGQGTLRRRQAERFSCLVLV